MLNLSRLGLSLMLTASLGACSQQSTYHRPDLDVAPAWQQESQGLTLQQAGPWWQGFQDPALDRLVEAVLAALLHNSKAGQQSLRRRFRSVDLLSYRHT